MDKDTVIRAIAADGCIRVFVAKTTDLTEKARLLHSCAPTSAVALGRTLTAAVMMGKSLKGEEKVTIRIKGDGPIGSITAVADTEGNVKGTIKNPNVYMPPEKGKIPVGKAIGRGMLYVIKDLRLKEPYTGSVPLVSGEIAEDLTKYYLESEQIPSAVSLGVLVNKEGVIASGGYIIQMLPGATDEMAKKIQKRLYELGSVSKAIADGNNTEDILNGLLRDYSPRILDESPVKYKCDCSYERIKEVLLSLGEKELQNIIEKEQKIEVKCHFCNTTYDFNKEQAMHIIEEAKSKKS